MTQLDLFDALATLSDSEVIGAPCSKHNKRMLLQDLKQQPGHKSIGSTMRYVTTSLQQASKATASALMTIF